MRALVVPVALSCSLGLSFACGPLEAPDATRSIGQQLISDGSAAASPGATVALVDTLLGTSFCSGTLVAPRVVITAAHCLSDVDLTRVIVAVGVLDVGEAAESQLFELASGAPHPAFGDAPTDDPDGMGEDNDVGLVVLAADAAGVAPVALLDVGSFDGALRQGTPVVIQGFGMSGPFDLFSTGTLREAATPYQRRSSTEFLAGGSEHPDTCNGDSGGPAFYVDAGGRPWLAGVTSRGIETAGAFDCGAGGIYTIAGQYAAWFEEASGGLFDAGSGAPPDDDPPPPPAGDDPRGDADDLGDADDAGNDEGTDGPPRVHRVTDENEGVDDASGCSATRSSSVSLAVLLLVVFAVAPKRRAGAGRRLRSSAISSPWRTGCW